MKRLAWWLAAAAMGAAATVSAGPSVWTSEGPYGGAVYQLLVNPSVPSMLYASTRGGLFRSMDSGATWARKEAGLPGTTTNTYALSMDADAPNRLWVSDISGQLYRSADGGDNWARTGYTFASSTPPNHLADVPGSVGKLLAATSGGVMASSDSGASFLPSGSGLPSHVPIARIAVDPANPLRMLAGTGFCCDDSYVDPLHPDTLYRSTDGGATWFGVFVIGNFYANVSDISFGAGSTVYAAVNGALRRSDDDGATWSSALPASGVRQVQAVAADPVAAGTVLIGNHNGISRSTDGGATSTRLNSGLTVAGGNIVTVSTIALPPDYPTNQKVWLGTSDSGVYAADLGTGSTWTAQNQGLAATNIRALAMFHDASTHRLFAGYGDASRPSPALFRGSNSGPGTPFSWATANTGLGALQIRSVAIDPTTTAGGIGSTRIYATGRGASNVADTAVARNGGIYRSLDGGSTWSVIDTGLPTIGVPPSPFVSTVRSLVLDPRSCASPPPAPNPCTSGPLQTIYAVSNGRADANTPKFRVMKSTNGGDSWSSSENGIPQSIVDPVVWEDLLLVPIVIDPANPQTLYVGTTDTVFNNDDGSPSALPPTLQSGVFKSIDGGANWTHSSNGLPRKAGSVDTAYDVFSLAINPINPQELWCSVTDYNPVTGASGVGGIYHTTDGGANWSNASTGITSADIRTLYVDPANPAVVYAAAGVTQGNPVGVFKSTNGGTSWTSISVGLPSDGVTALQVDPLDASVLHAGGAGVWSLTQVPDADRDGVPDAIEKGAPNGGDGNSDGLADYQQARVGSLGSAGSRPAGEGMEAPSATQYFTVSVTPVTGSCAQVVDAQSVYAANRGNDLSSYGDTYSYPHQLTRFEIQDCQKAIANVKFHGSTFGSGYSFRYFGPSTPGASGTTGWHDFTSRATKIAPDTWQLTLDSGQFGSYRPGAFNSILFEGGPGTKEGIFKNGFN